MRTLRSGVIVSVLLLVMVGTTHAATLHYGARAGFGASAFTGEFADITHPKARLAPSAAIVGEVEFSSTLSLIGELAYASKGGRVVGEYNDMAGAPFTVAQSWQFEYVELPMLIRGKLPSLGVARPYAEAGAALGFATAGRAETGAPFDSRVDLGPSMNRTDLGFAAGAGFDIAAGHGRVGLAARYTRGFADLYRLPDNLPSINQAWAFSLTYMK